MLTQSIRRTEITTLPISYRRWCATRRVDVHETAGGIRRLRASADIAADPPRLRRTELLQPGHGLRREDGRDGRQADQSRPGRGGDGRQEHTLSDPTWRGSSGPGLGPSARNQSCPFRHCDQEGLSSMYGLLPRPGRFPGWERQHSGTPGPGRRLVPCQGLDRECRANGSSANGLRDSLFLTYQVALRRLASDGGNGAGARKAIALRIPLHPQNGGTPRTYEAVVLYEVPVGFDTELTCQQAAHRRRCSWDSPARSASSRSRSPSARISARIPSRFAM